MKFHFGNGFGNFEQFCGFLPFAWFVLFSFWVVSFSLWWFSLVLVLFVFVRFLRFVLAEACLLLCFVLWFFAFCLAMLCDFLCGMLVIFSSPWVRLVLGYKCFSKFLADSKKKKNISKE